MKISPPIAVLAILAIAVVGTTWLSPLSRDPAQMSVTLPYATYSKLLLRGQADGRAQTVAQVIEKMAGE